MNRLIALAICGLALSSCQKDEEPPVTCTPGPDYMPLSVGNYWVYDSYLVDTLGTEDFRYSDSIRISGTTEVRGHQYFVLEGIFRPFTISWDTVALLRDSAGYLVNSQGQIELAPDNYSDTLVNDYSVKSNGDTVFQYFEYMENRFLPEVVPAGTFDAISLVGAAVSDSQLPGMPNPRLSRESYAPGVGKVFHSFFYFTDPYRIEKRLVRYHLET